MGAVPRFWWVVGGIGVLALWVSSGVYAATTSGLLGPKEPEAGGPLSEYVASYLAYRRELFPYEQLQNWALTVALLCLGLLGAGLLLDAGNGGRSISVRLGALAVGCGALVAAVGQVAYLGAVERVFAVSEIAFFDPGTLATIVDVVTRTDDYVENLGFLMVSVGLVALAWTREPWGERSRGLRAASWTLAIVLVAAAATSFIQSDAAIAVLLLVGFAVAPAWMLLAARTLDSRSASMSRG